MCYNTVTNINMSICSFSKGFFLERISPLFNILYKSAKKIVSLGYYFIFFYIQLIAKRFDIIYL